MPADCGWLRHDWGIENGFRFNENFEMVPIWCRGVPDIFVPSAEGGWGVPREKVCGRCGKRKPLKWRSGGL